MIELNTYSSEILTLFLVGILAFLMSIILTPVYTHFAYKHNLWKKKRQTATTGEKLEVISKLSTRKRRVPTMAGLIIVVTVTIITLLLNLDRQQTWLPLAALIGGATVGLIDDIINIKGTGIGVAGLRAPIKFAMITLVAAIGAWFFYYKLGYTTIQLPYVGDYHIGTLLIPLFILTVISTGNAVNISDGLDGLAGGMLLNAYGAFGIIAALQGHFAIAAFCMTVVGALLAYIWFNIPPARFFMGDVGSFSLGTALGVIAMLTDTVLLLPVIGVMFVLEAGSTLIQIASKRMFKRKIFIAAPIHHHFEAQGWPKTKVTMRFWIISQFSALIGVMLALLGGY